jgi:hypothetical protein
VTTQPSTCAADAAPLDQPDEVLDTACRILMTTDAPLAVDELAAALGRDPATIAQAVTEHERRGRIGRDGDGRIVASAGVSIVPSEYELHVGARQLWAWCAKTALGVMSALDMGGQIRSRSPQGGAELRLDFHGSRPDRTDYVVFWPSDGFRDSCGSAAEDYCPSFSMFQDAAAAADWARQSKVPGEVLSVEAATERAAVRWRASLDITGQGRNLASVLGRPSEGDPTRA